MRILVAGPAWVGDMVMAQSLFITLKQQYSNCLIDVIAPSWSIPLLQRMPQVHRGIELPITHKQLKLGQRYRIGRSLRATKYDLAIVTPRSFKSALVPFFARAKRRTGYRGEFRYGVLNDIRQLDKVRLTQTVQRYVALAHSPDFTDIPATPFPRLTIDEQNQAATLTKLGLKLDKKVVGFMPGAEYGPAKQWPVAYYRDLARQLVADDYQVWVFGSDKEKQLGENIAVSDNIINLCGRTSLQEAIDLMDKVSVAVTNDSGLMHVACATNRPVIAIYGSSDPRYTPPLSERAKVIYRSLDCSPCFERHCRFGHTNCLTQISVEQVYQTLKGV